jgi:hypothetical protein
VVEPAARPAGAEPVKAPGAVAGPNRTYGMEGWGESVLDIQNQVNGANPYEYFLKPFGGGPNLTGSGTLSPWGALSLDLKYVANVNKAFHSGTVSSAADAGVIVRTHWNAGGATAYEAPEAGTDVILPLMVRTVMSHTSLLYIQNTVLSGRSDDINQVMMTVYDNHTGDIVRKFSTELQPGDSVLQDTSFDLTYQGLPAQVMGGYIGSVHFESEEPITVLAYGEELVGNSTSAFRARPVEKASRTQVLPLVRSRANGESLIAIAHDSTNPVQVQVTYRGAGFDAASLGKSSTQSFTIAGWGSAYIDLGNTGLGTVDAPSIAGAHFLGSAVIEASAPVLVVDQDRGRPGAASDGTNAYNAFGPDDLSERFAAPMVVAGGGHPTELILFNPSEQAVSYNVDFLDGDTKVGAVSGSLAPGVTGRVTPASAGLTAPAALRAIVVADAPIAALVRDMNQGHQVDAAVAAAVAIADASFVPPSATPTASGTPDDSTPESPTPATGTPGSATPTSQNVTMTPGVTRSPTPPGGSTVYLPFAGK